MSSMFDTLKNAFQIRDLRKKIFFTLICVLVYRIGAAVPVPGISAKAFSELLARFGQLGQFLQIISGTGGYRAVSIFSLGISPYINASIIMQLLTYAIPALEDLAKEGESGRRKLSKYTRYLAVGLAIVMSFGYWWSTRGALVETIPSFISGLVVITSFTAGAAFIIWLADQIDQKGIGNGMSLIIFIGIISRLPAITVNLYYTFLQWNENKNLFVAILGVLAAVIVSLAMTTLVVHVSTSERRIPINYAKRVVGNRMYGGNSSYLPIKLNQGGVLPVIFAVSVMMVPSFIVSLFSAKGPVAQWFLNFDRNPLYYIIYGILIFLFSFFYSSLSFNPVEIATNIQQNGGYIPGYRPGRPTVNYIHDVSHSLCWFESIFLIFIVMIPTLLGFLTKSSGSLWFGGTALLIVVGVAMDMVNQLEAQMMMRHYKGFLD